MAWELREITELQLNTWATGTQVARVALSREELPQREERIKGGKKDQAVRMLNEKVEENQPAGGLGGKPGHAGVLCHGGGVKVCTKQSLFQPKFRPISTITPKPIMWQPCTPRSEAPLWALLQGVWISFFVAVTDCGERVLSAWNNNLLSCL